MVDFNGNSNGLNGVIEKDGQLDKQKIPNHYLIYERAGKQLCGDNRILVRQYCSIVRVILDVSSLKFLRIGAVLQKLKD